MPGLRSGVIHSMKVADLKAVTRCCELVVKCATSETGGCRLWCEDVSSGYERQVIMRDQRECTAHTVLV